MRFDPVLADIRFGCGLSPGIPPATHAKVMLATLDGPDMAAQQFPIPQFSDILTRMEARQALRKARRDVRGTPEGDALAKDIRQLDKQGRADQLTWFGHHLMRRTWTRQPLRERLASFWADHFTAAGKAGVIKRGGSPYVESALRPHISGLFEDLLIAAVQHPLMLHYLDQANSVGPDSSFARKKVQKGFGLNENLAREVLELHTLGAGGPYTQDDVRELAELFTGMTVNTRKGFVFRKDFAQPGAETVLNRSYGGTRATLRDVQDVLRDLARHPATARNIARKLAVHFVSDAPDPGLIAALEARYLETAGNLRAVYAALLDHPASWSDDGANVKRPMDFIGSALRALAVPPERLLKLKLAGVSRHLLQPLGQMGQIWEQPDGPDGLPEEDGNWITPQSLAARLQWAVTVPQLLRPDLPDPREFVRTALGDRATPAVRFVAEAAESRWDGVGLVLASPAFQRM
ncbi:DUF1800 domain-containing protein [Puniceibacterium confluentis]|uniref:DUF1800 domain-containing protein n=1 Tax=Puniceibacterium confluentis TaxID=1958944 RepID=UPI0011B6203A|nr:DUF1800 domain-containing protein [Puniceibacterium confluentis]